MGVRVGVEERNLRNGTDAAADGTLPTLIWNLRFGEVTIRKFWNSICRVLIMYVYSSSSGLLEEPYPQLRMEKMPKKCWTQFVRFD